MWKFVLEYLRKKKERGNLGEEGEGSRCQSAAGSNDIEVSQVFCLFLNIY
jgi:hypothetical protein